MSRRPLVIAPGELFEGWLESYKAKHSDLLRDDPDFARWLEERYVPLAGAWEY
jgi:hypothetical protein